MATAPLRNGHRKHATTWYDCVLAGITVGAWVTLQPNSSVSVQPDAIPRPWAQVPAPLTDGVNPAGRRALPTALAPELSVSKSPDLPLEYRRFPALGALSPSQLKFVRAIRRSAYEGHCAALDRILAEPYGETVNQDVAQARLLRKVEVSLAAMDAVERGLYIVVAADGPTPPLLDGVERIITGAGGHVNGQRAHVIIVIPHALYPAVAASKDYEAGLQAEQRRARVIAFNQLPIEERRAWRAKFLDRENLSHDEFMRLFDIMPVGTSWDEVSAMISDSPRTK